MACGWPKSLCVPSSSARPHLTDAQYQDLHHYFVRTLLTASLHEAVSTAYFGFRVYARGEQSRTPALLTSVRAALNDIPKLARAIREYPVKPATGGQWNWVDDADEAMRYYDWITKTGWPKDTRGFLNLYAGIDLQVNAYIAIFLIDDCQFIDN